jgi:hypothetical protein
VFFWWRNFAIWWFVFRKWKIGKRIVIVGIFRHSLK